MITRKHDYKPPTWGENLVAQIRQFKIVIKELYDLTKYIKKYGVYFIACFSLDDLFIVLSTLFQ